MPSKSKSPKCMDITNYTKQVKFSKTQICKSHTGKYHYLRLYYLDGDYEDFDGDNAFENLNKYLEKLRRTNLQTLQTIDYIDLKFIHNVCPSQFVEEPNAMDAYVADILKYIKLFLYKTIGSMDIVNLIMKGNYFMNNNPHRKCIYESLQGIYTEYKERERLYNVDKYWFNFDTFKTIDGMCNNFAKLQFLE